MIKLAIIGTGDMANDHVKAFNKIDDVKIVAACDVNKYKLADFVNKYNIEYLFADIQQLNYSKHTAHIHNLLNQLVNDNTLEVVRESNVYLNSSRLLQQGIYHDTILYRIIRSDK